MAIARLFAMLLLLNSCAREDAAIPARGNETRSVAPADSSSGRSEPPSASSSRNTTPASPSDTHPKQLTVDTIPANSRAVRMFVVVLNDTGKTGERVGCGDRVAGVAINSSGNPAPLRQALDSLLALSMLNSSGTGIYNALDRSALRVTSVVVADSHAVVHLGGRFSYGGVCDAPRIEAQLTRTATQFPAVRTASFFINGRPLRDMLSEK